MDLSASLAVHETQIETSPHYSHHIQGLPQLLGPCVSPIYGGQDSLFASYMVTR